MWKNIVLSLGLVLGLAACSEGRVGIHAGPFGVNVGGRAPFAGGPPGRPPMVGGPVYGQPAVYAPGGGPMVGYPGGPGGPITTVSPQESNMALDQAVGMLKQESRKVLGPAPAGTPWAITQTVAPPEQGCDRIQHQVYEPGVGTFTRWECRGGPPQGTIQPRSF